MRPGAGWRGSTSRTRCASRPGAARRTSSSISDSPLVLQSDDAALKGSAAGQAEPCRMVEVTEEAGSTAEDDRHDGNLQLVDRVGRDRLGEDVATTEDPHILVGGGLGHLQDGHDV